MNHRWISNSKFQPWNWWFHRPSQRLLLGSPLPESFSHSLCSLIVTRTAHSQALAWMSLFLKSYSWHPSPTLALVTFKSYLTPMGFSGSAVVKNLPASAGDTGKAGLVSGSGRSPGEGYSNPLQYSCLENSMDRGVRRATVHGVTKSQTWLICMH